MQPAIEPGRLARAFRLVKLGLVERDGEDFRVAGNEEKSYPVSLTTDPQCYCGDSWHRGRRVVCKHVLAARLLAGDVGLLIQFGEFLIKNEKFAREAGLL